MSFHGDARTPRILEVEARPLITLSFVSSHIGKLATRFAKPGRF